MNKILSILAICAIFGVASAALTDTHVLLTADEIASNFTGLLYYTRCPKDTQVAIFSIDGKKDDATTLNITRRIVDSTTFEKSKDIADVNFLKTFANLKSLAFASSQDGYFAIASSNGSFVSVTIFQADANLTDDKSYKVADAVLNATDNNLTIFNFYFQDNYFYVAAIASANQKMTAAYIQGVQAKDAKTLATSKGQVKLTGDNESKTTGAFTCSTVPGSGKPAVCTYNYEGKGAVFSRNVTFSDNTATAEATVVTLADTDALKGLLSFPTKEGVVSIVSSNAATSASYNGAAAVQIGNQIIGTPVNAAYYNDQYFVLSSGANNATPPVNSLYYTTFNITGVAAAANLTNVTIDAIDYKGQFIRPDQAFYIVYTKGTDKSISIGKLFDKISDKKSATILKSAIASIFVAAAMLFAF